MNIRSMNPKEPLVVDEEMALVDLAEILTRAKVDCVLAANAEGQFTGIFTTSDAFRLLYLLLAEGKES
jgi:CBS domain-containing protein